MILGHPVHDEVGGLVFQTGLHNPETRLEFWMESDDCARLLCLAESHFIGTHCALVDGKAGFKESRALDLIVEETITATLATGVLIPVVLAIGIFVRHELVERRTLRNLPENVVTAFQRDYLDIWLIVTGYDVGVFFGGLGNTPTFRAFVLEPCNVVLRRPNNLFVKGDFY